MALKPTSFEFVSYDADLAKQAVSFNYRINFASGKPMTFTERLVLPQPVTGEIPTQLLENILRDLHLIIGISYYKLYAPKKGVVPYQLTREQAHFWNTVYRKGLGEFAYRNKLDPKNFGIFKPSAGAHASAVSYPRTERALSMIGGGKDSIVSTELLKEGDLPLTALHIQTQRENPITTQLLKALELPTLTVERYLDEQIFQSYPGSYNGHVPISAVLAFISVLTGILYDYQYCVVANERSSNFGNIKYKGEVINHQWSKSAEFEELFRDYVRTSITPDVTYFSLLRHSYELRIAKQFAQYPQYFSLFSSCNRVARISVMASRVKPEDDNRRLWCGECAKCVFGFLILSAFLSKEKTLGIFKKNLFADKTLVPLFRDVLGYGSMKPFDCVGTFEEARLALLMAADKFTGDVIVKTFGSRVRSAVELSEDILQTHPAPLIPARFAFVGVRRALILGYGREGKVTEQYLKKFYPQMHIGIADQAAGAGYLREQGSYDIAIKTPGIPKEMLSIFYTTATNIFFGAVKNQIVGVTGSKGKSTTASLIHAMLKEGGKNVSLLGNIGGPMLSALLEPIPSDMIFVLELSSYQLDDIQKSPQIAVVTSLFPEHMNYHGNVQNYYEAKRSITKYQGANDSFVYNPRFPLLRAWAQSSLAQPVVYPVKLPLKPNEIPLLGEHNRDNAKAAFVVAHLLGISEVASLKATQEFKSLPHRLEPVGIYREIRFYDDAISTTPESTIEALRSLPDVATIFLGGQDRGYDFRTLEKVIKASKIKNIVLFPDSGKRIFKKVPRGFRVLRTRSMEKAVEFAYQHTPAGSVCLLSTASPSYSLWKDFNEKGDQFQALVRQLGDQS